MRIEIRHADPADIPPLAANMREADRREIWATSLSEPGPALARSLERSALAWTGLIDGRVAAMFGAGGPISIIGGGASAWLLGTPEIAKIPRFFLVESKGYVRQMLDRFPVLQNYVDARNRATLSWLRRLGAEFGEAQPYGVLGLDFVPFTLRAGNV